MGCKEKTPRTQTTQALESMQELITTIEAGISCSYCRKHFHYNIHVPAIVEYEYERRHYSYALKLEIVSDLRKWYYLLLAGWFRFVKPWLRSQLLRRSDSIGLREKPPHSDEMK